MADRETIDAAVKKFILDEFLPGEDPSELTNDTPLVTGGILDSIATLKLVTFLEEQFGVSVAPHEMDSENLDTITLIGDLVTSKL